MALKISSSAFAEGELIPKKYTCDGENVSPPLAWEGVPEGTKSLALVCDDPDAPGKTWVHWVIYGIPVETTELPENVPTEIELSDGSRQGVNDFGNVGYGGPCPPSGTHRYFFKLFALEINLRFVGRVTDGLLDEIKGYILAEGQLMGRYQKQ